MGLCRKGRTRGLTLTKMINLKTEKCFALEEPAKLLAFADEVIE
jgi:hypothetical protein